MHVHLTHMHICTPHDAHTHRDTHEHSYMYTDTQKKRRGENMFWEQQADNAELSRASETVWREWRAMVQTD